MELKSIDLICQIGIPLLSCLVSYNITSIDPKQRLFGFYCGISSQPMWYFTTLYHKQWGLFLLSLWYTIQWIKGIKSHEKSIFTK